MHAGRQYVALHRASKHDGNLQPADRIVAQGLTTTLQRTYVRQRSSVFDLYAAASR